MRVCKEEKVAKNLNGSGRRWSGEGTVAASGEA